MDDGTSELIDQPTGSDTTLPQQQLNPAVDGEENTEGTENQPEDEEEEEQGENEADTALEEEIDPMLIIELGDRVLIDSKQYRRTVGRVYYRSPELIRILPDGVSNTLVDFPRIYNEEKGEDRFDDSLSVEEYYVLEKHTEGFDSFVQQQDLQKGQFFETIQEDKSAGPKFEIINVNEEDDIIEVKDEAGETSTIEFDFIGIPLTFPFVILYKYYPAKEEGAEGAPAQEELEEAEVRVPEETEDGFIERPRIVIQKTGTIELPKVEEYKEAGSASKIYSDTIQKIDALNDFLNSLDVNRQKDPRAVRDIRILVEKIFQLKQELVDYNPDMSVRGTKDISAYSIGQLLRMANVPLGRPVVDMKKRILTNESTSVTTSEGAIQNSLGTFTIFQLAKLKQTTEKQKKMIEDIRARKETLQAIEDKKRKSKEEGKEVEEEGEDAEEREEGDETEEEEPNEKTGKLYSNLISNRGIDASDAIEPGMETDDYYVLNFLDDTLGMINFHSKQVSSVLSGVAESSPKFWSTELEFYNEYQKSLQTNSTTDPLFTAKTDIDIFRRYVPDLENPMYLGIYTDYMKENGMTFVNKLDNIVIANDRMLSTMYRKGSDFRLKQIFAPAEEATLRSYLMFPITYSSLVGSKRSGSVAIDSGRHMLPIQSMLEIFTELDGVSDVTRSDGIIALGPEGNTLGNITIRDYIDGIPVPGLGMGDAYNVLIELGLDHLELNEAVLKVLDAKFKVYQEQLISSLGMLRTEIAKIPNLNEAPVLIKVFDTIEAIEESIRSEPILVKDLGRFETACPTLVDSDLAKIAFIMKSHRDLLQLVSGQAPLYLALERSRIARDQFLEKLHINKILQQIIKDRGELPVPNKCPHVAQLLTIRRIHDESERYVALIKFTKKYFGQRKDNWIHCNVCKQELICIHERLQMEAFKNPREKDIIQKEMFLNFSDGVFQGHFICKHCGQPMQELGYDTHLEYDDQGRPMMGRRELVDKDALRLEEIEEIYGITGIKDDEFEFEDEDDQNYYRVIKQINIILGVSMSRETYEKIISKVKAQITRFPKLKTYNTLRKSNPSAFPDDYPVAVNRNLVCSTAIFIFLEIQSKIPDYTITNSLPNCVVTFKGYPLGKEDDFSGLQYMACILSSISRNESPWNMTGFMAEKRESVRREFILGNLKIIMKNILANDVGIQQQLQEKRQYLKEKIGVSAESDRSVDIIPFGFLPEQVVLKGEEAIIPEVASRQANGGVALTRLWIRYAHQLAHKTGVLIKNSPFMETTCCQTNIELPGNFWKSIPDLPQLQKTPVDSPLLEKSTIKVHFIPRPLTDILVETPENLMYRIFLKVCFQGPRKGLPHEVGLDYICPWCGFEFPEHPKSLDTHVYEVGVIAQKKKKEEGAKDLVSEGLSALQSQGVEITRETFQSLLDEIHRNNAVSPLRVKTLTSMKDTLTEVGTLEPPPFDNWQTLIDTTIDGLLRLAPDANVGDIAEKLGDLSNAVKIAETQVKQRVTPATQAVLDTIARLPWTNFFQVLKTYLLVPFEKLVSEYDTTKIFIPAELDLAEDHETDLKNIITNSNIVQTMFLSRFKKSKYAQLKADYFIQQLSAIDAFKSKLRPVLLPGRARTLNYIQRAFLYGPLADLINPNKEVPGIEDIGVTDISRGITGKAVEMILQVIVVTLNRFDQQRFAYDDNMIKDLIKSREEKEKVTIINYMAGLSPEERRLEFEKKRLGLGRWARGVGKQVYAYVKDEYTANKKELLEAGIATGTDDHQEFLARQAQMLGLIDDEGNELMGEGGEGDGYDFGEDDGENEDVHDYS
jgi:hypothetical protein